jgi:omega-amidase
MPKNLSVAIIQADLVWENPAQNLMKFSKEIESIKEDTDLIVLPEMFTTGFSMNPEKLAESMNGASIEWMKKEAKKKNCYTTGSIIIKENNDYFNRLIWMRPDESYEIYDKRHLFRMSDEHQHYTAGIQNLIIELDGWRIKPLICYDLRFPVWSRNRKDYDVLLYIANWPQSRSFAWKTLLTARAIENQAYVIGVNRIGKDGKGTSYSGDSCIIHPTGSTLSSVEPSKSGIAYANLQMEELEKLRQTFPVFMDSDDFTIKI